MCVTAAPLRCRGAGEERTRRELIPFVNESVDDEDEILLALAEELGDFVPLVGGAQHAHFLLPPLESLATVDETVVRERAVASICSVTAQMPPASVQEHLLPLLQVRLKGVGHRSCRAACCCWLAVHHGSALLLPCDASTQEYQTIILVLVDQPAASAPVDGAEAGWQRVAGARVGLQAVFHSIPASSGAIGGTGREKQCSAALGALALPSPLSLPFLCTLCRSPAAPSCEQHS